MPDGSTVGTGLAGSVGLRLKFVRQRAGLSQRELARRSDMTNGTLSNIEQGKASPSIQSLEKILNAIPITLTEFFSEDLETTPSIFRHHQFVEIRRDDTDFRILPINGVSSVDAYLAHQTYDPGAKVTSEWMLNKGVVSGIIAEGSLELLLDGVAHVLEKGDGFSFSIQRPHSFENRSGSQCVVVSVSFTV